MNPPPAPVPFLPLISAGTVDDIFAFSVAVLVAILFNAEGQGWLATLLGDAQEDKSERLHFNFLLHLDPLGAISFLLTGIGWPKWVPMEPDRFPHPRAYHLLSRLGGPFANLLLAAISASIAFVLEKYGIHDRVFTMITTVNVATGIYTLIPIPPLAGAVLLPIFRTNGRMFPAAHYAGAAAILLLLGAERFTDFEFITPYLDPLVRTISAYLLG